MNMSPECPGSSFRESLTEGNDFFFVGGALCTSRQLIKLMACSMQR